MKTISPALKAHLAQGYQTMCTVWMVTRVDGDIFGFTDHDQDITLPAATYPIGGGVTFLAASGYTPSDIVVNEDLDVANMEVKGLLTNPSITEDSLRQGLWDNAAISIFLVNWNDLSMGPLYQMAGTLGKVIIERGNFTAELRGLAQAYTRSIGSLCSPTCRANLGDSRCKVPLTAPTWSATTAYTARASGDASLGSIVAPTAANERYFVATVAGTSGGSEPSWNTTIGGHTTDGGVTWLTVYARTVNSVITGVNPDTVTLYDSSLVSFPGPTGGVSITGITNANPGVVTFTGTLALIEGEPVTIAGVVGMPLLNAVTVARSVGANSFSLGIDTSNSGIYGTYSSGGTVTPFGSDSGYFDFGVITMTNGQNDGLSMEVKSYVPGQITLQLPFGGGLYPIEVGNSYTMHAGCNKLLPTCRDTFFNILNMRAEPYVPGIDKLMQVGSPGQS